MSYNRVVKFRIDNATFLAIVYQKDARKSSRYVSTYLDRIYLLVRLSS